MNHGTSCPFPRNTEPLAASTWASCVHGIDKWGPEAAGHAPNVILEELHASTQMQAMHTAKRIKYFTASAASHYAQPFLAPRLFFRPQPACLDHLPSNRYKNYTRRN